MAFTSNAEDGPDPTLAIARRPPPASGCHAPCAPTASPTMPSWTARSRSSSTTGPWTPAEPPTLPRAAEGPPGSRPGLLHGPCARQGALVLSVLRADCPIPHRAGDPQRHEDGEHFGEHFIDPALPRSAGLPRAGEERVLEVFAGASHHMSCDRTRRARSRCLRARARPTHLQVFSLLGSPPLLTPSPARHAHD